MALQNTSDETKKVYCINCDEKQPYTLETAQQVITVRGKTFSYLEYTAFCAKCGNEVYVAEVNDMNCQARADAYRKA